jgi:glutamate-1-semialdehyde 2,1-aminomutase
VELFERATHVLVGGVNSPVRAFRAVGGTPVFVERAAGCHIFDSDGRRYIDLVGSWGPAIVGHAHPRVVAAVQEAATRGLSFGASHALEAQLAEVIVRALRSIELLRFVNSGTEATMSALRLARAVTGRKRVIKFEGCYHGHVDSLLISAGSGAATFGVPDSAGVPDEVAALTLPAPFNDIAAVEKLLTAQGRDVAAVLVEPVAGNMGLVKPVDGFLQGLRRLCDQHGCLLIFDEVMTGFRTAWGGYQISCGVTPDLTCLGKVIGGGLPVAAYGGPRRMMEKVSPLGPVYQAGTLSGNPLGMAAGLATLEICAEPDFYERISRSARLLADGLRVAGASTGRAIQAEAVGGMLGMFFATQPVRNFADAKRCDHVMYARFFHAMLERGVWLPPSGYEAMFVSSTHEDAAVHQVVEAARDALRSLAP